MSNHRYNPEPYIQDAINQITTDIHHADNTNNPRYLADKAEAIARFARALEALVLHQHNLTLDPTLAEDENYRRMVYAGYSIDATAHPKHLEVVTPIQVADKETLKAITTKYEHQVKHMQVTGYNLETRTHELTFTLKDRTTRTATATYTSNMETAILENLRLTNTTLHPHSGFTTYKTSSQTALTLHIQTTIH